MALDEMSRPAEIRMNVHLKAKRLLSSWWLLRLSTGWITTFGSTCLQPVLILTKPTDLAIQELGAGVAPTIVAGHSFWQVFICLNNTSDLEIYCLTLQLKWAKTIPKNM